MKCIPNFTNNISQIVDASYQDYYYNQTRIQKNSPSCEYPCVDQFIGLKAPKSLTPNEDNTYWIEYMNYIAGLSEGDFGLSGDCRRATSMLGNQYEANNNWTII